MTPPLPSQLHPQPLLLPLPPLLSLLYFSSLDLQPSDTLCVYLFVLYMVCFPHWNVSSMRAGITRNQSTWHVVDTQLISVEWKRTCYKVKVWLLELDLVRKTGVVGLLLAHSRGSCAGICVRLHLQRRACPCWDQPPPWSGHPGKLQVT